MSESPSDIDEIRAQKREELASQIDGESAEEDGSEPNSAPSEPIHVNGNAELQDAVSDYDVVLVDFYADWCGPCKMLEPTVRSLAESTDAAVVKVDIDQNQQLAQQYQVRGVPTLQLFSGGEAVEQVVGVRDESTLRSMIEQYL
ncbi:thioredoxin [Halobellus rufus]|uniref:thioredoxin n=1 Tax=Halobellus rufus TaxID=1448860 RepID=UPI000678A6AE|nr:thioredoxin [Halobellus rufus]